MSTVVRAVGPVILVVCLISAAIVVVSGMGFIDTGALVGADADWAEPGGVLAMAFFAFMVGAITTVVAWALARWLPIGLVVIPVVALVLGAIATQAALDQKPVLAPMFILLHVVFVGGLGFVLPYRLYHALHPPVRTPAVPA